jgi:hypothetical protein
MQIPKLRTWVVLSLAAVGLWLAAQAVPAQENGRALTGAVWSAKLSGPSPHLR